MVFDFCCWLFKLTAVLPLMVFRYCFSFEKLTAVGAREGNQKWILTATWNPYD